MRDYKQTILLPQTDFKMQASLGTNEPIRQKMWLERDIFAKRLKLNKKNPSFFLHDGPPYANNSIHAGHAFNKILKDIIIRYKNMSGYHADYIPGWDTHGLPIEVELKKQKITLDKYSVTEFRQECEKYALTQVNKQKEQFQRLGVLGKFNTPYLTLDHQFEANEIKVFAKLVEQGLIYRGQKPVYWSFANKTALAEAEIVYKDVTTKSIYVAFQIASEKLQDVKLVIWTTTPWTLPANLAVSVNPNFTYGIYQTPVGKLMVLEKLSAKLFADFGFTSTTKLSSFLGKDLELVEYFHPLFAKKCPIICGEHVLDTDGTGLVHTAPGHGTDDYNVGMKYNLAVFSPIDENGVLTSDAGDFAGLFYEDANEKIIEHLKTKGSLLKVVKINHSYPHDWRGLTPVIFRATPQWFCNIKPILLDIKRELLSVNFIPSWGRERLANMMENRTDWCISRQRIWGVPIPILYNQNDEPILCQEAFAAIIKRISKEGTNFWFTEPADKILPAKLSKKLGVTRKETDTLDVWFDSGTSFMTSPYNIDLYLEGSDQFRGWFNSSLISSVGYNKKAPYKTVITHGFILDDKGQKMSKSLGNVIDPNVVCLQNGADCLRLWTASVSYQQDVALSQNILKQSTESYRKIRNTIRYLLGAISDFSYELNYYSFSMLKPLEKVMTIKLNDLVVKVRQAYESYDFEKVVKLVLSYIVNDLSSFYLDINKDTIYILSVNDPYRRMVQSVMYNNLLTLLTILTPIIPHTTSEAYEMIKNFKGKAEDIYLTNMPSGTFDYPEKEKLLSDFEEFSKLRAKVLKELELLREKGEIKKSLEADLVVECPEKIISSITALEINLEQVLMVASVNLKPGSDITVVASKTNNKCCSRCWNYVSEINEDELCPRCASILKGREEK